MQLLTKFLQDMKKKTIVCINIKYIYISELKMLLNKTTKISSQ